MAHEIVSVRATKSTVILVCDSTTIKPGRAYLLVHAVGQRCENARVGNGTNCYRFEDGLMINEPSTRVREVIFRVGMEAGWKCDRAAMRRSEKKSR
uniref:Uncharacterized protein n=1 Tax=Pristionchus pacificus TaxID=54126 RepID=A0A2A6BWP4_PRIPA|eukprot:PDM70330.1 hypothetical protein PRIPAC_46576 [Pristionchus pacificus]